MERIKELSSEQKHRYARIRGLSLKLSPGLASTITAMRPVYDSQRESWGVDRMGRVYVTFEGRSGALSDEQLVGALIWCAGIFFNDHFGRYAAVNTAMPPEVFMLGGDLEIGDDVVRIPGVEVPPWYPQPDLTFGFPVGQTAEWYAREIMDRLPDPPPTSAGGDGDGAAPEDQDGEGSSGQGAGDSADGTDGESGGSGESADDSEPSEGPGSASGNSGADDDQDSDASEQSGGGTGQDQDGQPGDGDSTDDGGAENPQDRLDDVRAETRESVINAADEIAAPISDGMAEHIREQTAQDILDIAKSAGNVPDGMMSWATDTLAPPEVHWTKFFAQLPGDTLAQLRGHRKQSYSFVSRRQDISAFPMPGGRGVSPSILIALDTSGSMFCDGELEQAVSQATHLLRSKGVKPHAVQVMEVQAVVTDLRRVRKNSIKEIVSGGGGTDMRYAYAAVAAMPRADRPKLMALFTDGETQMPKEEDAVDGVTCVMGIIARDEHTYRRLTSGIPSWITPIFIPTHQLTGRAA